MAFTRFAVAAALLQGAAACPGSRAHIRASAKVTAKFANTCEEVQNEILGRIRGDGGWVDPHNAGIYTLDSASAEKVEATRKTGDGKYTDKMDFAFAAQEDGSCEVSACSESQVFSIADFSTNYCNLHDLYCGTEDGCAMVTTEDLTYTEDVKVSLGAGKDKAACKGNQKWSRSAA